MGQAQINVRTRACSRTSIARTKQAALTHNVRGKELRTEENVEHRYTREKGEGKRGRPKTRWRDAGQRDLKNTGLRVGEETDRAM